MQPGIEEQNVAVVEFDKNIQPAKVKVRAAQHAIRVIDVDADEHAESGILVDVLRRGDEPAPGHA